MYSSLHMELSGYANVRLTKKSNNNNTLNGVLIRSACLDNTGQTVFLSNWGFNQIKIPTAIISKYFNDHRPVINPISFISLTS